MKQRRWHLLLAATALALVPTVAVGAQEGDPAQGTDGDDGGGAVLLILDASGSMNRVDDRGVPLIEGARDALTSLVEVLPEGAPVGLRVYGHRVPNDDRANGCMDTELVVPVGPLDRNQMSEAIRGIDARGFTPIGLSLREAADDLPDHRGTIILVSDGEDTCAPPDPCEVARELVAEGIDVRVHTVGFFLAGDAAARDQLQCIADEGGGTYREIDAIAPFAAELGAIVQTALPELGQFHLPIAGGLATETAQPLTLNPEPGDWLDASGAFESPMLTGETRWYSVEIDSGMGIMAGGAHSSGQPRPGESLEVIILGSDLTDVRARAPRRGVNLISAEDLLSLPDLGVLGASTVSDFHPWRDLEDFEHQVLEYQGYDIGTYERDTLAYGLAPRSEPLAAGTYYVGFAWHSDLDPVEVSLGFGVSVIANGEGVGFVYEPIEGSDGPQDAPSLEVAEFNFPGGSLPPDQEYPHRRGFYADEIHGGETLWYRQTLEWDEAVEVQATLAGLAGAETPAGDLSVEIHDPALTPIGHELDALLRPLTEEEAGYPVTGATMAWAGGRDLPVGVEGDVYVAVTWTSEADEAAAVQLIVDVVPRYPEGEGPPDVPFVTGPADDGAEVTDDQSDDDGMATDDSQVSDDEQATTGDESQEDSDGAGWIVIWLAVGVAVTALVGGWMLVNRRMS